MLSARAYSFHQKSRLAISLSWVAGYTNVITFLLCGGIVVSHTTGNITHFGETLADGRWDLAEYFGFLTICFFIGAVLSALMTELAHRRSLRSRYVVPIAVQAMLLCVLSVGVATHRDANLRWTTALWSEGAFTLYWMTGLASLAMGLQNATITKISGAVIRTTHLTGVTTDLAIESVQLLLWWRDRTRSLRAGRVRRVLAVSRRHPTLLRVLLLMSIIGSFLLGAVLGTKMYTYAPGYALLLPISFLLLIIVMDWRKPVADVKELDLLADPELTAAGIVKSLLPSKLGIYRLSHHRRDAEHDVPDFTHWVERLPKKWQVVILAISPLTRLTPDAFVNLAAAAQRLHEEHRELILCGITPAQYQAMEKSDLPDVLDEENICTDLEFAIARGMGLLESRASVV